MGVVILLFIVVLLVAILAMPALRERFGPKPPPEPSPPPAEPHEVVVHRLDDHRGKKPGDESKPS
jgi:Na+-transporting methylmalonyl-CoA/oxaloacetate decarboxylase gamma subunit